MSAPTVATTPTTLAPEILVGGAPLPATWLDQLRELRVHRALRTIGSITLRFADPGYQLMQSRRLRVGGHVAVSVVSRGSLGTGTVTALGVEQRDGQPPELVVTCHDVAYKLTGGAGMRTYLKMSVADVVKATLSRAGLRAQVRNTPLVEEYLLQSDTDLGFIDDLAERYGIDWVVQDDTFVFGLETGPQAPSVAVTLGEGVREFSVRASGLHPETVLVTGWDRRLKSAVSSATLRVVEDPLRPSSSFVGGLDSLKLPGSRTAVPTAASADGARRLVEGVRARVAAATVVAHGVSGIDPRIVPGVLVDVRNAGPVSGRHRVTDVEHVYRAGGFETRFSTRPPARTTPPGGSGDGLTHHGMVVGVVTNNRDPDSSGRVKVTFSGVSKDVESGWARVLSWGGGAGRGAFALPEVHDEVLLAFEHGDLRHPVVLGGLHGGRDKVPGYEVSTDATSRASRRLIQTPAGHALEFGEGGTPAARHILLTLNGTKHRFRLGEDRVDLEVPQGTPVRLTSGRSTVDMDGNGGVKVAATTIELAGTSKLTMKAPVIEVKADSQLKLEGSLVDVKGSGMVKVAGGATAVSGNPVKIN